MASRSNRLGLVVIALGWVFDFLFWKKVPGINFALFATLCLIAGLLLLLADAKRPHRNTTLLLPFFGFFVAVTFIRIEPLTSFLAYTFTLLLMSIMAVSYLGGKWIQYGLADYFFKYLRLIASMIAKPMGFSNDVRKSQVENGQEGKKTNFWPVLRGILLALPVLLVFASLLSSADVIFNQKLKDITDFFRIENLPEYIFRLVYILIIAYALAGVILHAASESRDEKLVAEGDPMVPKFLGFIESIIILGSVSVLFAGFVAIQFQYFFGGHANINIEGFTYSEYARNGFGELVTVAFFSLIMLLGLSSITRREGRLQKRMFTGFGVAVVALVMVILVSAYQRLALYESAYGFSRLRTYTHVFLIWIGILLAATMLLEMFGRERFFALAALITGLGFAASLPLLNVDRFIVQQNIQRELGSSDELQSGSDRVHLDAHYFLQLSDDALPRLVDSYRNPAIPEKIRSELGAALACIRKNRGQGRADLVNPWQSFHLARVNAENALQEIEPELDGYSITDHEWPGSVLSPEGQEFECWTIYMD